MTEKPARLGHTYKDLRSIRVGVLAGDRERLIASGLGIFGADLNKNPDLKKLIEQSSIVTGIPTQRKGEPTIGEQEGHKYLAIIRELKAMEPEESQAE